MLKTTDLHLSELFQNDLNEILSVLKKYDVERVFVYGSIARGDYKNESDLDICVEGLSNNFFFMALAECMMKSKHSVSITDFKSTYGYFRERILKEGRIIYEKN